MKNNHARRAAAKAAGSMFFQSETPCKRGHTGERYTSSGGCHECAQRRSKFRPDAPNILFRQLVTGLTRRSVKKGWTTNVTAKCLMGLYREQDGRCAQTGIKFTASHNTDAMHAPFVPSVDRIDSSRPYTIDNIQLVVWMYNRMKGEHTAEEFAELLSMIPGVQVDEDAFCSPY